MMLPKKDAPVVAIALLLALTNAPKTFAASWNLQWAGTSANLATFPLPTNVPQGTALKIASSSGMAAISQALKQGFEGKFPGSAIASETSDANTAIKQLLDGKVDLAAISRPLTANEKAAGLVDLTVSRDKIAVVVNAKNGFTGELTDEQFAKIFRGEITDWSQVGGQPGAIRVIDRPETSDLRQSFKGYPIFDGNFATGSNAVALSQDNTDEMLKTLDVSSISYAPARQVLDKPGVRLISMWGTPPTDPRYPFSQPFTYVYKGQNPTLAVQAFLGYASAPEAQPAIEQAKMAAIAPVTTAPPSPAENLVASPSPAPSAAASPGATGSPSAKPSAAADPGATALVPGTEPAADTGWNMPSWIWWLLPLGLLAILLGWLFGDRRTEEDPEFGVEGGRLPEFEDLGGVATTGLEGSALGAGGAAPDFSRDTPESGMSDFPNLAADPVRPGDVAAPDENMFSGLWGSPADSAEDPTSIDNAAQLDDNSLSGLFGDASNVTDNALEPGGDANLFGGASERTGMDVGGGAIAAGGAAMAAGAAAGSALSGGTGFAPVGSTPTASANRIVLVPREPHRAHVYWEIPNAYKDAIRQRGGEK
ncbi:MAG: substrate-binding domain-containing protein, partial [Cyanobacteria bacterium CAN_BIN43]|nr:substrate-binding domain-containing protein [Cyanobacteria bacterium CAN_BIN43]